jgi:hypothetical protein
MSTEIIFGSVADLARTNNYSIAEAFAFNVKALLVIDVSASMAMRDCQNGHSRYAMAVKELERLQRSRPGKVGIVEFSTIIMFAAGGIPSPPQSSTNLTGALEFIHPADDCGIEFWIISDGEPDNPDSALDFARKFKTKINTIYIGPEGGAGAEFLRRLSALTGGRHADQGVQGIAHLSDTMQRLLTA